AALALLGSACAKDLDTTRSPAPRGTIGEELFGVICDRVGAQALHEDLTGASFQGVCHKDLNGDYDDAVDERFLPAPKAGAVDVEGKSVSVDEQQKNRDYA